MLPQSTLKYPTFSRPQPDNTWNPTYRHSKLESYNWEAVNLFKSGTDKIDDGHNTRICRVTVSTIGSHCIRETSPFEMEGTVMIVLGFGDGCIGH